MVSIDPDKVNNKYLYVILKKEGEYHVVDKVSENRPTEGIYIRGKFKPTYISKGVIAYRVDYGMDKYFMKQGSGLTLQAASRLGGIVGTARIFRGYGVLTGVAIR